MKLAIREISGTALPLRGDSIDTDRIYPARRLRVVSFEGVEKYVFEDDRKTDSRHPFNQPQFEQATILLVEKNFGAGSSREHAPQALKRRGLRVVVGVSFGEIFFYNSVAIGLPCVSVTETDAVRVLALAENEPRAEFQVDLESLILTANDETFSIALPESARQQFVDGTWNSTVPLLEAGNLIEETAGRLPYLEF